MRAHTVDDRDELAGLLRRDPALRAYELGDLDDKHWPHTTWYRLGDAVVLLYRASDPPTLLAVDRPDRVPAVTTLLDAVAGRLPARMLAHVAAGAEVALAERYALRSGGEYLKMVLTDRGRLDGAAPAGELLGPDDLADLVDLYDRAYPGHWFRPKMLDLGPYLGIRLAGRLVAAAGTHLWSPAYRVAALGNVATDPEYRGRGLATAVVAAWCVEAAAGVDHVALNVRADNTAALTVYHRLGFTVAGRFVEHTATARG